MRLQEGFVLRKVGENCYIFRNLQADMPVEVFALNETGVFLWDSLREEQTLFSLAKLLENEYGIDAARALQDTTNFIQTISAHGCIKEEK